MAKNKKLGMGLDLLLSAAEGRDSEQVNTDFNRASKILEEALKQDEEGNFLEAYYLYRRLIDSAEDDAILKNTGGLSLFSQAFNNAAIILYEHGYTQEACTYLEKSIAIEPDNQVAWDNLEQLKKS